MTYGNGNSVSYLYDMFDRTREVWYNNVVRYVYHYTADGSLGYVEDRSANEVTYYVYDGIGRLVRETTYASDGEIVADSTYDFDEYNRTSKSSYSTGTYNALQTYTYDNDDGSLSGLVNTYSGYSDSLSYIYDHLKRLSRKNMSYSAADGIPMYAEYTYADNPVDSTKTTTLIDSIIYYTGTEPEALWEFGYTYDNLGNISAVDNFGDSVYYTYDAYGQLVEEIDEFMGEGYRYEYDKFGNITAKYKVKNEAVQSTYAYTYDSAWRDRLASYNGSAITYDAIGNPLSYRGYTFTWTDGRKLATAAKGTTSMSFTYKGDLRASKTVDGVTHYYYYSGNNIVSEVWGDKSLTFLYDESGAYGFIYDDGIAETLYYYLKNLQGDVICLLDETLQPVVYYHYNAYGELIKLYEIVDGTWDEISLRTVTDHIAFINPLRYRSYYYDNDLKLYYLTTRYYDCVTGRFINADRLVSTGCCTLGYNMYIYCDNNPIMHIDPVGYCAYNGTAADFHRFEHNLPSLSCGCDFVMIWAGGIGPWGEPNTIVEDYSDGYRKIRYYDSSGRAYKDIHYTDHKQPHSHTNPHEQYWDWSNPEKPSLPSAPIPSKKKNKDEQETNISNGHNASNKSKINSTIAIVTSATIVAFIIANDFTGVGISDDALIAPLIGIINESWKGVFA